MPCLKCPLVHVMVTQATFRLCHAQQWTTGHVALDLCGTQGWNSNGYWRFKKTQGHQNSANNDPMSIKIHRSPYQISYHISMLTINTNTNAVKQWKRRKKPNKQVQLPCLFYFFSDSWVASKRSKHCQCSLSFSKV